MAPEVYVRSLIRKSLAGVRTVIREQPRQFCESVLGWRPRYFVPRCLAQRCFCAAAILALASGDKVRRLPTRGPGLGVPAQELVR